MTGTVIARKASPAGCCEIPTIWPICGETLFPLHKEINKNEMDLISMLHCFFKHLCKVQMISN